MGLRQRIEDIINTLFDIAGINATMEVKNYQIIEEVITEVEENETVSRLNALPDDIRAKVMDQMSAEQLLELAGLKPTEAQPNQPSATPNSPATPVEETLVNDKLKGLSAKENQDIMRIVRDFSKGRINEVLARHRLMAYGFDTDTITQILGL